MLSNNRKGPTNQRSTRTRAHKNVRKTQNIRQPRSTKDISGENSASSSPSSSVVRPTSASSTSVHSVPTRVMEKDSKTSKKIYKSSQSNKGRQSNNSKGQGNPGQRANRSRPRSNSAGVGRGRNGEVMGEADPETMGVFMGGRFVVDGDVDAAYEAATSRADPYEEFRNSQKRKMAYSEVETNSNVPSYGTNVKNSNKANPKKHAAHPASRGRGAHPLSPNGQRHQAGPASPGSDRYAGGAYTNAPHPSTLPAPDFNSPPHPLGDSIERPPTSSVSAPPTLFPIHQSPSSAFGVNHDYGGVQQSAPFHLTPVQPRSLVQPQLLAQNTPTPALLTPIALSDAHSLPDFDLNQPQSEHEQMSSQLKAMLNISAY